MIDIIGYIFIFLGTLLLIISSIGLLRMPDALSKIHAATKSSTLGSILVLTGAIFLEPTLWLKLTLLIFFILFTNPLSSSILGRSSYKTDGVFKKGEIK